MASNNSIKKTLGVALGLCIVCSVVVSTAAVVLRPMQMTNAELDRKSNILAVAELLQPGEDVGQQFRDKVTAKVVDLNSGEYVDDIDPEKYDQAKMSKDPATSRTLSGDEDLPGIKRREQYSVVYLVGDVEQPDEIIVPVRGNGLWSMMYGYLALKGDGNTVVGLSFYQQGETPGLGGEVDNPKWKAQWDGKKIYPEGSMDPEVHLKKGGVNPSSPDAKYQVDALSGATLTSNGVTNLLQFWMGENGFAKYLTQFRDVKGA